MVAYVAIGVFVAICAIGWAIIVAHTEGTPGISPEVIAWRAGDHSVSVRYQVGKPRADRVRCRIVAYDPRHAVVGQAEVTVPAGTTSVDDRREVATSSRATAVDVRDCRTG